MYSARNSRYLLEPASFNCRSMTDCQYCDGVASFFSMLDALSSITSWKPTITMSGENEEPPILRGNSQLLRSPEIVLPATLYDPTVGACVYLGDLVSMVGPQTAVFVVEVVDVSLAESLDEFVECRHGNYLLHHVGTIQTVQTVHTENALLFQQNLFGGLVVAVEPKPVQRKLDVGQDSGCVCIGFCCLLVEVKVSEIDRVGFLFVQSHEMMLVFSVELNLGRFCGRQKVHNVDRTVLAVEVLEMFFENRLSRFETSGDLNFGRDESRILFPEHRNRASDLGICKNVVFVVVDEFCLDKVGNVAVVVDSTHVEPRARPFPGLLGDDGEFGLSASNARTHGFCKTADHCGEKPVFIQHFFGQVVQVVAELDHLLHHERVPHVVQMESVARERVLCVYASCLQSAGEIKVRAVEERAVGQQLAKLSQVSLVKQWNSTSMILLMTSPSIGDATSTFPVITDKNTSPFISISPRKPRGLCLDNDLKLLPWNISFGTSSIAHFPALSGLCACGQQALVLAVEAKVETPGGGATEQIGPDSSINIAYELRSLDYPVRGRVQQQFVSDLAETFELGLGCSVELESQLEEIQRVRNERCDKSGSQSRNRLDGPRAKKTCLLNVVHEIDGPVRHS
ncbi:hypothetical protein OGAPHI_005240 [Ogataea philodendri]|uniref:Uncharacterized protein n=1 Tax=Ogataea philodendri TaxID=1378263 RepID=A0A9P8P2W5_9ASCO|nr:uncharacterized protein OGAPHI_005240 [Ogataea philodendri]KAH3663837.1 hypothetical protein OGAPHI_005240 [Ogataea philodendri]